MNMDRTIAFQPFISLGFGCCLLPYPGLQAQAAFDICFEDYEDVGMLKYPILSKSLFWGSGRPLNIPRKRAVRNIKCGQNQGYFPLKMMIMENRNGISSLHLIRVWSLYTSVLWFRLRATFDIVLKILRT
jgi:hypothetical protein